MAADPLSAVAAVATVANVASSVNRSRTQAENDRSSALQTQMQAEAQAAAQARRRDQVLGSGRAQMGRSGLMLDGVPGDALTSQADVADQQIASTRAISGLRSQAQNNYASAADLQGDATLLSGLGRFGLLSGGGGGL